MCKTIDAAFARGVLVALIGALLMVAGPGTAEAKSEPQGTRAEAGLIAAGAGYSHPHGSARVQALQRRLHRAGESPGPVDGRFGPLTEAAVRRFQSRQGLAVDGLVGPLTAAALRQAAALITPGAGYGEPHGSTRVRALQRQLRRAGERPGPIDGRFGPLTEAAVRHFQRDRGLVVDGLVGEATGGALGRSFAVLASERRHDRAPRSEEPTANAEHGVKPTTEPEPARAREANPPANPGDSGFEFPVWGAMLTVVAALALLSTGAVALALGRHARWRERGAQVRSALLTGPLRPYPPTPRAPILELRRPPAPKAGGLDGRRGAERPADLGGAKDTRLLGYASVSGPEHSVNWSELREQEEVIAGECERRGVELLDLVRDREPENGRALERPGLGCALRRISAGEAAGLAVSELSRLTRSVAELGTILDWFTRSEARLVAVAEGLDTGDRAGRLTARSLIEVSGWERERLNEESVPTVRGGAEWRPSSVQAGSVGHKRRRPPRIGPHDLDLP